MSLIRNTSIVAAVGLALALTACGKKEEAPKPVVAPAPAPVVTAPPPPPAEPAGVSFVSLTLGNAVDASQNVATPTTVFAKTDTIYASVATNGASPSATIAANWTYGEGQEVNQESKSINATGPAVTTFHIAKPDGWPAGKYNVAITIDGKAAGSQSFEVQ
jgi:hypothetical protein